MDATTARTDLRTPARAASPIWPMLVAVAIALALVAAFKVIDLVNAGAAS